MIIILYFAGWLSFFKIFYPHGTNVSLFNLLEKNILIQKKNNK